MKRRPLINKHVRRALLRAAIAQLCDDDDNYMAIGAPDETTKADN